jgi:hypothetical protein
MRPKLTYANVMATIAVFMALGGASYAALKLPKNSVGAKQLRRNAVTTAKIKNGAITAAKVRNGTLTGNQINTSTLGTVPNAASADAINGQIPTKIFKTLTPGQSNVVVATISGFAISASCESENADVTLTSPSSASSVLTAEGRGEERGSVNSIFDYDSQKAGTAASIRLDKEGSRENDFGQSSFSGATSTGTVVSGELGYDFKTFGGEAPERCVVYGEVTSG